MKTWIAQMKEDLKKLNLPYQDKEKIVADKDLWRAINLIIDSGILPSGS